MKRSPADIAFSKCIRERAQRCEYCEKITGLECAHFYGRRARNVRWDEANAFSLCHYHHRYFTENPAEFVAWAKSKRGEGWYDLITEKWRNVRRKITKVEEKEIAKHYREELKKMQKKRNDGVTGWLEFVNYE